MGSRLDDFILSRKHKYPQPQYVPILQSTDPLQWVKFGVEFCAVAPSWTILEYSWGHFSHRDSNLNAAFLTSPSPTLQVVM